MNTFHRGAWSDSLRGAVHEALADKGVDVGEYIELDHSTSDMILVPVSGEGMEIHVEVHYSESRGQYQAILRRQPVTEH